MLACLRIFDKQKCICLQVATFMSHIKHLKVYPFNCNKILEKSESRLAAQIHLTSGKHQTQLKYKLQASVP